ncbi:MAG: DUF4390 domain-containing protein [Thiothrix sp.]
MKNSISVWLAGLMLVCLMKAVHAADAEQGIRFREFSLLTKPPATAVVNNLRLDYTMNAYLREGLLNGMTLEQEIRFELERYNAWWWNSKTHLVSVHSELQYQPVTKQYQVTRLDTQEHWTFPTLPAALQQLGSLSNYRLPDLPEDAFGNNASIFATAVLAPQSLRLPLKLHGLFSDRYALTSDGVLWPLP